MFVGEVPPVLAQSRQQHHLRRLHSNVPQRRGQLCLPGPGDDSNAQPGKHKAHTDIKDRRETGNQVVRGCATYKRRTAGETLGPTKEGVGREGPVSQGGRGPQRRWVAMATGVGCSFSGCCSLHAGCVSGIGRQGNPQPPQPLTLQETKMKSRRWERETERVGWWQFSWCSQLYFCLGGWKYWSFTLMMPRWREVWLCQAKKKILFWYIIAFFFG